MCNACKNKKPLDEYNKKEDTNCSQCMKKLYITVIDENGNETIYRECLGCGETKPLQNEYFKYRKDNNTFRGRCKECQNANALETSQTHLKKIEVFIASESIIICVDCKQSKLAEDYVIQRAENKFFISKERCEECVNKREAENQRKYVANNREEVCARLREDYRENIEDRKKYSKQKYEENREERIKYSREYNKLPQTKQLRKQWREKNKERLNAEKRINNKKPEARSKLRKLNNKLYYSNPSFRLRKIVSSRIRLALIENNSSKNNKSITKYLPYTIQELKLHIEQQFESWMNWNNLGKYNPETWNEKDPSTWTWQIDHIDPHANFQYKSMEDEAFQQCWALSNLRPYSSKQNNIDGGSRIRHKPKT
jgi:hypothetical protein